MSEAQPASNTTPKDDRRRRGRGRGGKKTAADGAEAKAAAAPAASSSEAKPTLKEILNQMNRQINPKLLSEQDRKDLTSILEKLLNKVSGNKPAKGEKAAAAAAASSDEQKSEKKAEKKEKAEKKPREPREPVDISGTLVPALMSGLQSFVAYIDAQMAPKEKDAPKTPSLSAQLASLRRSPAVDALNQAQRGQVLNILVGTTVLLAQRLASLVANLPPKSEAATADGSSAGSSLTPEARRQLRTLRPALHLLVAASAHIRQPNAEASVVNVDAAVIQVAAQSFGSLSRSLNLLDFLSLSASMSFSLQRLNQRLKAVAAIPGDQKLDEVAKPDADALSSLLSDKQLRIILGQFNRLPKRAAIREQLAALVDGVEMPKRGPRRNAKAAAASSSA